MGRSARWAATCANNRQKCGVVKTGPTSARDVIKKYIKQVHLHGSMSDIS